ncbi:hypothetical protein AAVH_25458, partial [Aphelenchoides avenae]
MSQTFDAVAETDRANRAVAFETDIALGKHANDQRAYGCTGNAHWYVVVLSVYRKRECAFRLLYSSHEKSYGMPVQLKLLNACVMDECVASIAFYVRNSLDYKLTKLTEFKTVDLLAVPQLEWNPYPDVPSDYLVGARIRLLREVK